MIWVSIGSEIGPEDRRQASTPSSTAVAATATPTISNAILLVRRIKKGLVPFARLASPESFPIGRLPMRSGHGPSAATRSLPFFYPQPRAKSPKLATAS